MTARKEYEARKAARDAEAARLDRLDRLIGWARLAGAAAFVAALYFSVGAHAISARWLVLPAALFAGLVVWQGRARDRRDRARRASAFYARNLDRLDGRWMGKGQRGEAFAAADHTYALDLDVVGEGSLFELLCTARTLAGEAALARYLLAPASIPEIRARQAAVVELRGRLALREDLALAGEDARAEVDPGALARWGESPPLLRAAWLRRLLFALNAALAAAAVLYLAGAGALPFFAALALVLLAGRALSPRARLVTALVERPQHHLAVLAHVLARLEREPFAAPKLRELQARLAEGGVPASRRIAELGRRVELLSYVRNEIFLPVAWAILWAPHFAFAIEAWRRRCGPLLGAWMEAAGELEALCALGAFAYEHPDDPFPELLESGPPRVEGEGLAHPLVDPARFVRNDVRLGGGPRLLLLSGSNMSGKSTLLRTLGANAVLALAGAPVRAKRLALTPLAIGCTLRVQDSLMAGASRFYAEITRLRQIVDLTRGPLPVLFLLDEILHGTNSRDRRQGAEGVLRGLVDRGAIGICTTHDLALAEIVGALGPAAANGHFGDRVIAGKLEFDYRLQPGVVEQSNAIELMRAVGLEV